MNSTDPIKKTIAIAVESLPAYDACLSRLKTIDATIEKTTALEITAGAALSVPCPVPPIFCTACGKSMQDPKTGTNIIGMSFRLEQIPAELIAPFKNGVSYCLCYPCWMKNLGIKP